MANEEIKSIGPPGSLQFTDVRPCDMADPEMMSTKVLISTRAPNIDGYSTNLHHGLFSRDEIVRLIASLEEALEGVAA